MNNKNPMSDSDKKKIVISIAAGVTFVIGFGIGVQLYEVTNESPSNESDRNLSQIEVTDYSVRLGRRRHVSVGQITSKRAIAVTVVGM